MTYTEIKRFKVYVEVLEDDDDSEITVKTFNVSAIDFNDAYNIASKVKNDKLKDYHYAFGVIDIEPITK